MRNIYQKNDDGGKIFYSQKNEKIICKLNNIDDDYQCFISRGYLI